MAISVTFTDAATTATYNGAYLKIVPESVQIDFLRSHCEFDVFAFITRNASDNGKREVAKLHFTLDGSDFTTVLGNPALARVYGYLKTLNLFNGAVDA